MGNLLNISKTNEAIKFYKNKLKKIYQTHPQEETLSILDKLEKLLAQKTGLLMKEQENNFGKIPEFVIATETQKFLKSYHELNLLKKKILANYGRQSS